MNISDNVYVMHNKCTLVKYNIESEYGKMCRDYLMTPMVDVMADQGILNMFTKNYSYGLLTYIYHTNVFILDIDTIKRQCYFNYADDDHELVSFAKKYNAITGERQAQQKLNLIIAQYKKIFGNKLKDLNIYKTNQNGGIHIYFELDDYYDLSGVYKYELSKLVACNGYLKFVIYSGYSNIRVTNKVLSDSPLHLSRITKINEQRVFG